MRSPLGDHDGVATIACSETTIPLITPVKSRIAISLRPPRVTLIAAIDLPSGIDASTGEVQGHAVRAAATVTFHAAKPGLWIAPGTAFSAAQNQAAAFARVFGAFVERSAAEKTI